HYAHQDCLMSLIYKSLQRAQNEDDAPSVVVPRRPQKRNFSTGISKQLGGFLVVFVLFSLFGFFFFTWVQQEVTRLSPQVQSDRTAMEKMLGQKKDVPAVVNATIVNGTVQEAANASEVVIEKVEKILPALTKPTKVQFTTKKKLGMEDLVKPTTDLERHFASLARKNQSIMELEKNLVQNWKRNRLNDAAINLKALEQAAGEKSVLVGKWKGLIALKQGQYAVAEDLFRSLLAEASDDLTVRLNLVQSILAQGNIEGAKKELLSVKKDFPGNAKVAALESRAF
ncbi:MAG: tetratricopeptide repeat protein, partial [Desulfoplanes sp.]|nr:tetratricopeptide repeat protein [Desulfoplanes sp.]